jgi:hypothetical protein
MHAVGRDGTRFDVLMGPGQGKTYPRLICAEQLQVLVARALEGLDEHDGWKWEEGRAPRVASSRGGSLKELGDSLGK